MNPLVMISTSATVYSMSDHVGVKIITLHEPKKCEKDLKRSKSIGTF